MLLSPCQGTLLSLPQEFHKSYLDLYHGFNRYSLHITILTDKTYILFLSLLGYDILIVIDYDI